MKIHNFLKTIIVIPIVLMVLLSPTIGLAADAASTATNAGSKILMQTFLASIPGIGLPITALSLLSNASSSSTVLNAPVEFIGNAILAAGTFALGSVVPGTLTVATKFLDFMLVGMFNLGFTPNDNAYIAEGWGIVRNLANAVLVLGLVIIAINIILGREENKAKKTLISFILIALLINFTPVICGFIIDGSNILTRSFVTGGINSTYSSGIASIYKNINENALAGGNMAAGFAGAFITTLFAVFAIVIFFLYALLFIARTVILWILVIVSPIAFATKVLPQSKYVKKIFPSITYWDDWWENFMQWCVIGIPAGLSIYISNKILSDTASFYSSPSVISAQDPFAFTQFLFAYAVPFIFLIAGFFISISAGGQVGSFVGGVATGAWAMSGGKLAKGATDRIKAGGEWMIEGGKRTAAGAAVGGITGAMEGYSDKGWSGLGRGVTGVAMGAIGAEGREKAAKKIAELKEGVGWERRGSYDAELKGGVEEAQKRLTNSSKDDLVKIASGGAESRASNMEKAAAYNELNKRGDLEDKDIEYLISNKKWAETFGVKLKDVAKARPEYAPRITGKSVYETVSTMSPADAGKTINSSSFSSGEVLSALHGNVMKGKINKGTQKDIENIQKGYADLLQKLNTFSGTTVLPEDTKKLVANNLSQITAETDKMINSGNPEEVKRGETIRKLITAQDRRQI